ncbi:diaminobutyrate--2-oxoglutarate transaminase [Kribbella sp. NPDC051587]|uniref:diaminobutyrate--2-oxoglutarate transaminase n=1 Tax=Kribbella sp. NPDC051587 TaxID=3364119 RepID=UPI0037AB1B72
MTDVFTNQESNVRSYCRDFPAVFTRAEGHHLWDSDGRRYIDLLSGAGALNYGHNPADMVARVIEYLNSGGPVQSLDLHTLAKQSFLERLRDVILEPRGMGSYVVQFPGPAGTLAVEAALKLARKVTGRTNVLAFHGGFHGTSLGSLAATSSPLLRGAAGTPLRDVTLVPYNEPVVLDPAHEPPAAILLETVQGEGGLRAATGPWLQHLRQIADSTGALLIVDDIQAGCGRTGTFFSFEPFGVLPDLVCLSKSLSGMGLPMAAVLIKRKLDQWAPGEHNGTFRGHNLGFVAGTAAMERWADPLFTEHVSRLADAIPATLQAIQNMTGGAVTVVGRGAMSGLRFANPELASHVRSDLYDQGVIAETAGGGHVLKLVPPLTMPLADWVSVGAVVTEVVAHISAPASA